MDHWWTSRCCLVTDDTSWAHRFVVACDELNVEVLPWEVAVRNPAGRLAVLVADAATSWRDVPGLLGTWAARALQPCVVVHQRARSGSARLMAELARLGFGRVVQSFHREAVVAAEEAVAVRNQRMWTIPYFATALRATDPDIVVALAAVAEAPGDIQVVKDWGRRVGLVGWELRRNFRVRDLPAPKRVLDRLRLALVVAHVVTEKRRPTKNELARRFGYASGRYLGRCTKRIAGRPLGVLRQEHPIEVIRELAVSARRA